MSWSPKQNPYLYLYLDLHRVLFFSFFFSKLSTWSSSHVAISSFHVIITFSWVPPCSTLGLHQHSSYHNSWQRLEQMFHQLSKTKLGLSPTCRPVGQWAHQLAPPRYVGFPPPLRFNLHHCSRSVRFEGADLMMPWIHGPIGPLAHPIYSSPYPPEASLSSESREIIIRREEPQSSRNIS